MDVNIERQNAAEGELHIVLLSAGDPLNVLSFSGSLYYMAGALRLQFPDLEIVRHSRPFWFVLLQRVVQKITKGRVEPYYWRWMNRWFAARLLKRWKGRRVAIIGIVNASLVCELAASVPVINVSDATWDLMKTEHEIYWSLNARTAASAEYAELNSTLRSVHSSYSSNWAAQNAIHHYGGRREKVSVISWGCNFDFVAETEVRRACSNRAECRLLFIGGEWVRKGGDIVCDAADILASKGIPVRVDFVGASPPADLPSRPWMHPHGYLSKSDQKEAELLRSLMRDAELLFLPTRRDCTPMVFAEANAYGTPALTRNVGGVADVVHDGANGIVLQEDAQAEDFAAAIEALWNDPQRYARLRASARNEYETRLNWDVWARQIAEVVRSLSAAGRI
jgi:glycosyltransferase involved in cell wall biosynthesis